MYFSTLFGIVYREMKQFLVVSVLKKIKVKKLMKCCHLLEWLQYQVYILKTVVLIGKKLLNFLIVVDVLSSLTISPNKSELYSSVSTPDSSAKGSLPQTPSTW